MSTRDRMLDAAAYVMRTQGLARATTKGDRERFRLLGGGAVQTLSGQDRPVPCRAAGANAQHPRQPAQPTQPNRPTRRARDGAEDPGGHRPSGDHVLPSRLPHDGVGVLRATPAGRAQPGTARARCRARARGRSPGQLSLRRAAPRPHPVQRRCARRGSFNFRKYCGSNTIPFSINCIHWNAISSKTS